MIPICNTSNALITKAHYQYAHVYHKNYKFQHGEMSVASAQVWKLAQWSLRTHPQSNNGKLVFKNIASCKTRNSRQDFKYGRDLRHVISFPIGLALVRTSQHKSEGKIINEGRHPRHVVAPTTHWVYFIMTINILDSITMFTNRLRQHVSILIYKFKCG